MKLGPRGNRVWRQWKDKMGTPISERDLEEAREWFYALYLGTARLRGEGRPLTADEHAAVQAGIHDEIEGIMNRKEVTDGPKETYHNAT